MSLETAQAISVLGNVHEMESYLLEHETEDGTEEIDMCVAIQNIMHYCESAGKEVGRYEGRQEGLSEGICAMILDNLEEGVEKPRIIQKLERHFSLSSEEAEEYFEQVGKNTVSH
jgi:predicted transposase YdaD